MKHNMVRETTEVHDLVPTARSSPCSCGGLAQSRKTTAGLCPIFMMAIATSAMWSSSMHRTLAAIPSQLFASPCAYLTASTVDGRRTPISGRSSAKSAGPARYSLRTCSMIKARPELQMVWSCPPPSKCDASARRGRFVRADLLECARAQSQASSIRARASTGTNSAV